MGTYQLLTTLSTAKDIGFDLVHYKARSLATTLPTPWTIFAKKLDQELPQMVSNYCESRIVILELLSLRIVIEMQKL
jgi:hypothetical protein